MSKRNASFLLLTSAALVFSLVGCSTKEPQAPTAAQEKDAAQPVSSAAARPPRNPLKNAYFGDLHLHSGYSMDAFAFGTRTTPEDSYKYAMGETVEYMGKPQKRIAPLDFLAVTDHAEYLGVVRETIDPNGPFAKSEWYTIMTNPDPQGIGRGLQENRRFSGRQQAIAGILRSQTAALHLGEICGYLRQVLQARQVHYIRRIRVDVGAAVSEPASLRDLRRQRPGHALHSV